MCAMVTCSTICHTVPTQIAPCCALLWRAPVVIRSRVHSTICPLRATPTPRRAPTATTTQLRSSSETATMVTEAPAGSWQSPITSALITSKSKALGGAFFDSHGNAYWSEGRPAEKGRTVIVRRAPDGTVADVTPGVDSGFNIRTRVHEYGGGAAWMGDQHLYFTNFAYA